MKKLDMMLGFFTPLAFSHSYKVLAQDLVYSAFSLLMVIDYLDTRCE
jgi:hypothetical protein